MKQLTRFIMILIIFITLVSCSKSVEIKIYTDDINCYESINISKGEILSEPNDPYKYGYIFVEWQVDGVKYNFNNEVMKSFSLNAKFEKINEESIQSAKLLFPSATDNIVMELAGVIQKNKINVEKMLNEETSLSSLIDFIVNENDIKGMISFFITYVDTLIKYDFEKQNLITLSDESKNIIQKLYTDLKANEVYDSLYINFEDDLMFCDVFLPIVIASHNSYNSNTYLWLLHNSLIMENNNNIIKEYSIYRLYDKVRFLNKTTNNSYTIKFNEIAAVMNYINEYESIDVLDKAIIEYNNYYLNNLEAFRFINNKNNINNNSENLKKVVEENSELLIDFFLDLKDSYNIISGLQGKFNELQNNIQNIQSLDGLKETIYGFIDFKDQILISLKISIPSDEVINCLNTIINSLNVDDYFKTKINRGLLDEIVYLMNNISSFVRLYENMISYLESINSEDYNIDLMIESYYNDDIDTFNKEYDKMISDLNDVIKKTNIFNTSNYQSFKENMEFILPINCSSIDDLINVLFGVPGSEKFIEDYYNEYNGFSDTLDSETEMRIFKYLYKQQYGEITYEDLNEVSTIVDDIINNIKPSMFYKTNNLVVYFYNSLYEYNNQRNITNDFKIIRDNIDIFKNYYKLYFHIMTINELKQYTDISDKEVLLKHFEYLRNNITDNTIQSFIYLFNNFDNNTRKIEIINNNYLNKIDEVINILKENHTLSENEIQFINEVGFIFNIRV